MEKQVFFSNLLQEMQAAQELAQTENKIRKADFYLKKRLRDLTE
jgi:hypothetical protein